MPQGSQIGLGIGSRFRVRAQGVPIGSLPGLRAYVEVRC